MLNRMIPNSIIVIPSGVKEAGSRVITGRSSNS